VAKSVCNEWLVDNNRQRNLEARKLGVTPQPDLSGLPVGQIGQRFERWLATEAMIYGARFSVLAHSALALIVAIWLKPSERTLKRPESKSRPRQPAVKRLAYLPCGQAA
jgi:hypothetical protein